MLNIGEYRNRSDRLADHLPWAALVAPGVILNKDGSFQRTFRFRGPDLESATEAELVAVAARVNNLLRRFGSGWALFFEAERFEASGYPESRFPDAASWLVDKERQAAFEGGREHFESLCHFTLLWLPPPDSQAGAERLFVESPAKSEGRDWRETLKAFVSETERARDLLSELMPEVTALDDGETLTHLHSAISCKRHKVVPPAGPIYLDALLADTPLVGGLEPILGDRHLRTVSLLGFPSLSSPGILDALNHQDFPYRWTTRFIALDKSDSTKALTRLRRQWFNKRKSVTALLREVLHNQPAQLLDSDADNKAADADLALQALGQDYVAFGYLTTTISVTGSTASEADDRIRSVERIVNGLGFTAIRERLNALEAWLSGLPGQVYANVRQPLVHTLNLAHLMPLSSVWAGPERDSHLDGPPLLLAETGGSTPFRLSAHVGDVGHMLVVGPTGAGKSVLLALLSMQFRRYDGAAVYIFDKGWSARAAVLAMGGAHHALGLAGGEGQGDLAFQPLRGIDQAAERSWACEWLGTLLAEQNLELGPEARECLWSALLNLSSAPPEERTLTGLSLLLQSAPLRSALRPYTLEGAFGQLLDSAEDRLSIADVHCFEMEALMGQSGAVLPVLTYLFHRLEERFDGRPTLLVLDEAWVFLDNPLFAARIREWLKILRKKNVSVVFATQSLADISESSIAPAIVESCPQRIFLANDRAAEPQARAAYERFGLNARQVELIGRASPKRHYYLQSSRGNRLFELGLGPIALAFCGASDSASRRRIDSILQGGCGEPFAKAWLESGGLSWAAALVEDFDRLPHRQGEGS
jgi:type IV secretion system protein VirB4